MRRHDDPAAETRDDDTGSSTWIVVLTAIVVTLATALGVGLYTHFGGNGSDTARNAIDPQNPFGDLLGRHRPAFELADLEGEMRSIDEWDGQVVLLNFWATWCPPCRREMPTFVDMQKRYGEQGLSIVAVAIDQPEPVLDFIDAHGINFPVLIGSADASLVMERYGNRFNALPFSVVLDRQGRIRHVQPGEVTEDIFAERVLPLL